MLARLVEHGIVLAEPANRGSMYRLNRSHVLAGVVLAAVGARAELIGRISEAVARLQPSPISASLFGSFARGEATADSEIDLLVVVDADQSLDAVWEQQLQDLEDKVLAWSGNRLERLVLDTTGLRSADERGEAVVDSWRRDAIHLAGLSLQAWLDGAQLDAMDEPSR